MKHAKAHGEPQSFPRAPAFDLQPALYLCTRCQRRVLRRVWNHATGWRALAVPLTPVFGEEHHCTSTAATLEQALQDDAAQQRWGHPAKGD